VNRIIILKDPPCGSDRSFNGLPMVRALTRHDPEGELTVFLMADTVACDKAEQKMSEGIYNIEEMLRRVLSARGRVLMCGTCMDARGLTSGDVVEGAARFSMDELAEATLAGDRVLVF